MAAAKGSLHLAVAAALLPACSAAAGETLYNGVVLPHPWPPRLSELPSEPATPPYLQSPPPVIPIHVGRQLFVDDFLVEKTTLRRTFHTAQYVSDNPVLRPDRPWEQEATPTAMPFSDGVWYDPLDRLFKMWYMGGYLRATCYAVSRDGLHWEKPSLPVVPGTNIVHPGDRDSTTVWLDLFEQQDPGRRFKLFRVHREQGWRLSLYFSPDGIHWGGPVAHTLPLGDRTTAFYNPFRRRWVYSIRVNLPEVGRARAYWEHPNVVAGAAWESGEPYLWTGADRLDARREDLGTPCQLYNLDAVAYESVLLGLFTIWRGQPADRAKPNEVCVGFSRDGFHWTRGDRRPFLPVSERYGDWNWGNVQSAGGGCLVVGDRLFFYVSGRAGVRGSTSSGVSSTGLATLRRDGFASLDASNEEGTLTTRPVTFRGRFLFVNAAAQEGQLRAEVLDLSENAIAPFTAANSVPFTGDRTCHRMNWKGARDLSLLAGKPVRFRFHLRQASLYAFWVSPDATGASHGYVGAGGPGFVGPTDTVGQ
ncbi:MAG: glycosyl hydrolase family 32 [Armatimonadota bacterium]|nr:glycosyl hydrolase family 32 [Armatimonadota bacterium]